MHLRLFLLFPSVILHYSLLSFCYSFKAGCLNAPKIKRYRSSSLSSSDEGYLRRRVAGWIATLLERGSSHSLNTASHYDGAGAWGGSRTRSIRVGEHSDTEMKAPTWQAQNRSSHCKPTTTQRSIP